MTANRFHFRAWDVFNGNPSMIGPMPASSFWRNVCTEGPGVVIMQSTGKCDAHGKEVFEGDVVRGVKTHTGRRVGHVVYSRAGMVIKCGHESIRWLNHIEVIGNVYENPDWRNK